jgi:transcriptional regulator with XRE-family HTH domain
MRFQRKLGQLLDRRKANGDKAAKGTLADYCGRDGQSWVSNMLSNRATQPNLEDLENIADFFQVSVNELLRPANPKELSADEQRVVLAFRSVPEPVQVHFLALLEAASLNANLLVGKRLRQLRSRTITTGIDATTLEADPAAEVSRLKGFLRTLTLDVTAALADAPDHQPTPGAGTTLPKRGKVAPELARRIP